MINPAAPPKGEALLVLDSKLTVRAVNKAFFMMFRLAPDECVGHKAYELGGRAWDPKLRTMLEAVLRGIPQSDHFELVHDKKEGGGGVLWLSARLVPSADFEQATVLLSIRDLSGGRPVEETLAARTKELQALAELASHGAHELNNLLTVIRMNADIMETTLGDARLPKEEAAEIRTAVKRAESIARQLLLSSRRVLPQLTGLDRGTNAAPLRGSPLKESVAEAVDRASAKGGASTVRRLKHGAPTGRETILLVDDEESLRKLGKRVLTEAGYHVLDAADGSIALRIAAEQVGELDLVVTDVEMPTLGGRGMVEELHELSPGLRVLFMSGYTDDEILRRGLQKSEANFLQKPFTAESLCAAVRAALSKPATAST